MDNNKIIHLYLLNRCTHKCELCCNKQYIIDDIPVVTVDELKYADTICLTGGEPFLLDNIDDFAGTLKRQYPNINNIYVYTCGDSLFRWMTVDIATYIGMQNIDGVSISPKNRYDAECVNKLFKGFLKHDLESLKSNRIYIFPEVRKYIDTSLIDLHNTKIMYREWQKEFNAQSGIFRRLPILFE